MTKKQVLRRWSDTKVAVAYPSNEDPFDTRDRAERRERYKIHKLAMNPILTGMQRAKNVCEMIRKKAAQSEPKSDSNTPSSSRSQSSKSRWDKPQLTPKIVGNLQKPPAIMLMKRKTQSEVAKQLDEERRRQHNTTRSSGYAGNNNMGPGCSKGERSTIIGERDQTGAAAASSDKPSSSEHKRVKRYSPVRRAKKQQPKLPIIDIDRPTDSNGQSQRASNTTTTSMAPPQPTMSVEQPRHSDHQDHQRCSQDGENSHSNFQPIIKEEVRETDTNQIPRTEGISSNEPYASHHLPSSLKKSALLYSQMDGKPSLIPMHEPVERRIRLNSERLNTIAAQNKSNLMDQRRPSPRERQEPTATQNSPLKVPHYQISFEESNDMHAPDPKVVLERLDDIASGVQHTPTLPHQRLRLSQYHQDMNLQPRPSEPQVGIPTNTSNDRRLPTVQGVAQRSPPHAQPSTPDSIRQSLKKSYRDYLLHYKNFMETLSQFITPAATGEVRSLERPYSSSQHDRRELPRSDNDSMCQPSLSHQRLIHQFPEVAMKRVYSEGNIANPSAVRSLPRSADHVRQTDKRIEVDPVSLEQSSSSDPKVSNKHEVIPEQETFTNDADCAGTSAGQGSASAESHSRHVLEQQRLNHIATNLTQMGSDLHYSCKMYNNLRGSILESADTIVERFNAMGATESIAAFSSNVAPKILPINAERQSRAAKRANSTNHNQHTTSVDKEPSSKKRRERWRVVLKPEHDPNDTKWTLKCRKLVPGLQELSPGRGIYVDRRKLMYAERVSGDCKSLVSLVLEEVFSEIALIVCSTWHENPKMCLNGRPTLDAVAVDALFTYVKWYGSQRGWNIDTGEIIRAIDNKIYEIRAKHDLLAEHYSQ